jgi:DDE superfamily endonuclease
MSKLSDVIVSLLCRVLSSVPIGTNRGLFTVLWALLSGRFLASRGAVFPALAALGLADAEVRRAEAALTYGSFRTSDLVSDWHKIVREQGHWRPHSYEGIQPVACDLSAFYRSRLRNCTTKHYNSQAGKALPALVYGLCVEVGSVGGCPRAMRLGLPRLLLRQKPGETEADLQRRLVREAAAGLASDEALVIDAGFSLAYLLAQEQLCFVVRMAQNTTARKNALPPYSGKGRPPEYGEIVRPLPRKRGKNAIAATKPDANARWKDGRHTIKAYLYENLVASDEKPGGASFRLVVIFDPRYNKPLIVATNLTVTAHAIWQLYRDRWPIEQLPLAAKQILGAERSFVSGTEARFRLPELALLAGNILSYVAATAPAVPTGFWDRCCRPTCGRLRRCLERLHFSELPLPEAQLRKKASITDHLPKGVHGHRRQKASEQGTRMPWAA